MTDPTTPVLGSIGDLVEDIRVQIAGTVHVATDTDSRITRTRGGSAANVAVAAAGIEGRARFIGQVGADSLGDLLITMLGEADVEVAGRRGGRTGTVVVLVQPDGERTMLTDRGSSHELTDPDASWLDGLHTLHIPAYSLVEEPLATTAIQLATRARDLGVTVSIDASSTAIIERYGVASFVDLISSLQPTVVFANTDEAELLGGHVSRLISAGTAVVVHGPDVASAHVSGDVVTVDAVASSGVDDTTGAGDAFAAGFCCAWATGGDLGQALVGGHAAAHAHLSPAGRVTGSRAPR